MPHKPRSVSLFAFALVLAFAHGPAEAQVVKPFKVTGGGFVPQGIFLTPGKPAFHWATGQATELGSYYGEGFFTLLTPPNLMTLTADFSSAPDFTFTAANGDNLVFTYGDEDNGAQRPGNVTLQPQADGSFTAVFVAEFNPFLPKCTGRFAKVTGGSFIMIAKSAPFALVPDEDQPNGVKTTPFAYTWQGSGTLTFAQGK
jgi:hypothetical protein